MREVDRMISRRSFLRRAAIGAGIVSASLIVGDAMVEELGKLFPRRLVAGVDLMVATNPLWSAAVAPGQPFTQEMFDRAVAKIWRDSQPYLVRAIS